MNIELMRAKVEIEAAKAGMEIEAGLARMRMEIRKMEIEAHVAAANIAAQLAAGALSGIEKRWELFQTIEPDCRSLFMKRLTAEIKKMSELGLPPELIAELINPESL